MKTWRKDVRLPEKLSDLIRVAAKDMEQALLSEEYTIDMGLWHASRRFLEEAGEPVQKCAVCYAGTVMAGTLGANKEEEFEPADFGKYNHVRLTALDCLRSFNFYAPLREVCNLDAEDAEKIYGEWHHDPVREEMRPYDSHWDYATHKEVNNFDEFFASQMKMADWLEKRGL